jgi:DGQHR domain-containing protein
MTETHKEVVVRALHTVQGDGVDVYSFFIKGKDILKIADLARIERDEKDKLQGFQRPEIRSHVNGIVDYLNSGKVLFPNAIILAMRSDIRFVNSRGPRPQADEQLSQTGTLTIPVRPEGEKVAWVVDGQQRSLALSKSANNDIAVPVVAFVSNSLGMAREQFILVNKAKPLPTRLINELLPETESVLLPRELSNRRTPSELCNLLHRDERSPFHGLIRRPSDGGGDRAVITDTAVITMIRNSLNNPLGALSPFKGIGGESPDIRAMYSLLIAFWAAVANVFPDAWGRSPRESRLTHSAGIEAMGVLMDRIYTRVAEPNQKKIEDELLKIAPHCRWTDGVWDGINLKWNEIQNTPRDIKRLQEVLIRLYAARSMKG